MHKGTRHMRNSISHCEPTTKVTCLLYAVLPAPLDPTLLETTLLYSILLYELHSAIFIPMDKKGHGGIIKLHGSPQIASQDLTLQQLCPDS